MNISEFLTAFLQNTSGGCASYRFSFKRTNEITYANKRTIVTQHLLSGSRCSQLRRAYHETLQRTRYKY